MNDFFEIDNRNARTDTYKLRKRTHILTNTRANAFSIRVVNPWNDLPEHVVGAPLISVFKNRLDEHWNERN